jgi:acyl carrier protein
MTQHDDTLGRLLEILQRHDKQGHTLTPETELVADLGLDSVQVMELLLELEDEFDVSIPLNVLPDVRTVNDLCGQIRRVREAS